MHNMGNFALGNGPVQRGQFIFNPPVLFAEFLAACSVDTVGMFAPMLAFGFAVTIHAPPGYFSVPGFGC
jgi:hypothetical protein